MSHVLVKYDNRKIYSKKYKKYMSLVDIFDEYVNEMKITFQGPNIESEAIKIYQNGEDVTQYVLLDALHAGIKERFTNEELVNNNLGMDTYYLNVAHYYYTNKSQNEAETEEIIEEKQTNKDLLSQIL